jgi:Abi-like protein
VAASRRAIPGLTNVTVPLPLHFCKGCHISNGGTRMSSFGYAELESAISPARAGRYLRSTIDPTTGKADPATALALYEYNTGLSSVAWTLIADIEVILRNVLADAVAGHHQRVRNSSVHRWYDEPPWFSSGKWLTDKTMKSILQAMKRVGDPGPTAAFRPGEGRVVAELTLGFWRYLLIARYEHSLWNPAIRARFPSHAHLSGSDSRKAVHARVEALNYLRNRVAHHEPIYEPFNIPGHTTPVEAISILLKAIELIWWTNPIGATWIQARSTLMQVATTNPLTP